LSVVVDASVVVAALVDTGASGTWAEEILTSAALHAPELARVEVMNILRRLERARRITIAEASAAYEDLMDLELEAFPFEPFAARVWELRHTLTCYDAWYVAVAEALGAPLATLDVPLSTATGPTCEFLTPPQQ
jgi:predicted nucleic acid-binding protein